MNAATRVAVALAMSLAPVVAAAIAPVAPPPAALPDAQAAAPDSAPAADCPRNRHNVVQRVACDAVKNENAADGSRIAQE